MSKQSNQFQKLIYLMEAGLAANGVTVRESVELEDGVTGSNREVDILLRGVTPDGKKVSIAVECRDHARKQDVTWIEQIIGKYSDLDVDEVTAVSKSGFYEPAIKKAEKYGIRTLSLDAAEKINWVSDLSHACNLNFRLTVEELEYVRLAPEVSRGISCKQALLDIAPEVLGFIVYDKEKPHHGSLASFLDGKCSPQQMKNHAVEAIDRRVKELDDCGVIRLEVVQEFGGLAPFTVCGPNDFEFSYRAAHFGVRVCRKKLQFPLHKYSFRGALVAEGSCEHGGHLTVIQAGETSGTQIHGLLEAVTDYVHNQAFSGLSIESIKFEEILRASEEG